MLDHWRRERARGSSTAPEVLAIDSRPRPGNSSLIAVAWARDPRDARGAPCLRRRSCGRDNRFPAGGEGQYRRIGRRASSSSTIRWTSCAAAVADTASCRPASTGCCWCRITFPRGTAPITRIETLDRALSLRARYRRARGTFDLCPADACQCAGCERSRWCPTDPRPRIASPHAESDRHRCGASTSAGSR